MGVFKKDLTEPTLLEISGSPTSQALSARTRVQTASESNYGSTQKG